MHRFGFAEPISIAAKNSIHIPILAHTSALTMPNSHTCTGIPSQKTRRWHYIPSPLIVYTLIYCIHLFLQPA